MLLSIAFEFYRFVSSTPSLLFIISMVLSFLADIIINRFKVVILVFLQWFLHYLLLAELFPGAFWRGGTHFPFQLSTVICFLPAFSIDPWFVSPSLKSQNLFSCVLVSLLDHLSVCQGAESVPWAWWCCCSVICLFWDQCWYRPLDIHECLALIFYTFHRRLRDRSGSGCGCHVYL